MCKQFSASLQGSKWAITMHPVSVESTLLIIPSYIELPSSKTPTSVFNWHFPKLGLL